jgi:hypothetical protein
MAEKVDFREKQYAFARHIRDPENNPAPAGTEDRRMAVYRELFFNNLKNLLSQTFPVLRKLHDNEKWHTFIRQFMAEHEAHTPYFLEIPREFLNFLETGYRTQDDDFPFLLELAHYEWVELALSVSEETVDLDGVDPDGDLLECIPVKSPLAWLFCYQFPVHRISAEYIPEQPGEQPTFLAICRKANDDMDFMELNAVTAHLLSMIENNDEQTGRQLLVRTAEEIKYPDTDMLIEHGLRAMEQMRDAEILLGVKQTGE